MVSQSRETSQSDRDLLLGLSEYSTDRKSQSDNVFIRNCFLLTSKLEREMKDNSDLELERKTKKF